MEHIDGLLFVGVVGMKLDSQSAEWTSCSINLSPSYLSWRSILNPVDNEEIKLLGASVAISSLSDVESLGFDLICPNGNCRHFKCSDQKTFSEFFNALTKTPVAIASDVHAIVSASPRKDTDLIQLTPSESNFPIATDKAESQSDFVFVPNNQFRKSLRGLDGDDVIEASSVGNINTINSYLGSVHANQQLTAAQQYALRAEAVSALANHRVKIIERHREDMENFSHAQEVAYEQYLKENTPKKKGRKFLPYLEFVSIEGDMWILLPPNNAFAASVSSTSISSNSSLASPSNGFVVHGKPSLSDHVWSPRYALLDGRIRLLHLFKSSKAVNELETFDLRTLYASVIEQQGSPPPNIVCVGLFEKGNLKVVLGVPEHKDSDVDNVSKWVDELNKYPSVRKVNVYEMYEDIAKRSAPVASSKESSRFDDDDEEDEIAVGSPMKSLSTIENIFDKNVYNLPEISPSTIVSPLYVDTSMKTEVPSVAPLTPLPMSTLAGIPEESDAGSEDSESWLEDSGVRPLPESNANSAQSNSSRPYVATDPLTGAPDAAIAGAVSSLSSEFMKETEFHKLDGPSVLRKSSSLENVFVDRRELAALSPSDSVKAMVGFSADTSTASVSAVHGSSQDRGSRVHAVPTASILQLTPDVPSRTQPSIRPVSPRAVSPRNDDDISDFVPTYSPSNSVVPFMKPASPAEKTLLSKYPETDGSSPSRQLGFDSLGTSWHRSASSGAESIPLPSTTPAPYRFTARVPWLSHDHCHGRLEAALSKAAVHDISDISGIPAANVRIEAVSLAPSAPSFLDMNSTYTYPSDLLDTAAHSSVGLAESRRSVELLVAFVGVAPERAVLAGQLVRRALASEGPLHLANLLRFCRLHPGVTFLENSAFSALSSPGPNGRLLGPAAPHTYNSSIFVPASPEPVIPVVSAPEYSSNTPFSRIPAGANTHLSRQAPSPGLMNGRASPALSVSSSVRLLDGYRHPQFSNADDVVSVTESLPHMDHTQGSPRLDHSWSDSPESASQGLAPVYPASSPHSFERERILGEPRRTISGAGSASGSTGTGRGSVSSSQMYGYGRGRPRVNGLRGGRSRTASGGSGSGLGRAGRARKSAQSDGELDSEEEEAQRLQRVEAKRAEIQAELQAARSRSPLPENSVVPSIPSLSQTEHTDAPNTSSNKPSNEGEDEEDDEDGVVETMRTFPAFTAMSPSSTYPQLSASFLQASHQNVSLPKDSDPLPKAAAVVDTWDEQGSDSVTSIDSEAQEMAVRDDEENSDFYPSPRGLLSHSGPGGLLAASSAFRRSSLPGVGSGVDELVDDDEDDDFEDLAPRLFSDSRGAGPAVAAYVSMDHDLDIYETPEPHIAVGNPLLFGNRSESQSVRPTLVAAEAPGHSYHSLQSPVTGGLRPSVPSLKPQPSMSQIVQPRRRLPMGSFSAALSSTQAQMQSLTVADRSSEGSPGESRLLGRKGSFPLFSVPEADSKGCELNSHQSSYSLTLSPHDREELPTQQSVNNRGLLRAASLASIPAAAAAQGSSSFISPLSAAPSIHSAAPTSVLEFVDSNRRLVSSKSFFQHTDEAFSEKEEEGVHPSAIAAAVAGLDTIVPGAISKERSPTRPTVSPSLEEESPEKLHFSASELFLPTPLLGIGEETEPEDDESPVVNATTTEVPQSPSHTTDVSPSAARPLHKSPYKSGLPLPPSLWSAPSVVAHFIFSEILQAAETIAHLPPEVVGALVAANVPEAQEADALEPSRPFVAAATGRVLRVGHTLDALRTERQSTLSPSSPSSHNFDLESFTPSLGRLLSTACSLPLGPQARADFEVIQQCAEQAVLGYRFYDTLQDQELWVAVDDGSLDLLQQHLARLLHGDDVLRAKVEGRWTWEEPDPPLPSQSQTPSDSVSDNAADVEGEGGQAQLDASTHSQGDEKDVEKEDEEPDSFPLHGPHLLEFYRSVAPEKATEKHVRAALVAFGADVWAALAVKYGLEAVEPFSSRAGIIPSTLTPSEESLKADPASVHLALDRALIEASEELQQLELSAQREKSIEKEVSTEVVAATESTSTAPTVPVGTPVPEGLSVSASLALLDRSLTDSSAQLRELYSLHASLAVSTEGAVDPAQREGLAAMLGRVAGAIGQLEARVAADRLALSALELRLNLSEPNISTVREEEAASAQPEEYLVTGGLGSPNHTQIFGDYFPASTPIRSRSLEESLPESSSGTFASPEFQRLAAVLADVPSSETPGDSAHGEIKTGREDPLGSTSSSTSNDLMLDNIFTVSPSFTSEQEQNLLDERELASRAREEAERVASQNSLLRARSITPNILHSSTNGSSHSPEIAPLSASPPSHSLTPPAVLLPQRKENRGLEKPTDIEADGDAGAASPRSASSINGDILGMEVPSPHENTSSYSSNYISAPPAPVESASRVQSQSLSRSQSRDTRSGSAMRGPVFSIEIQYPGSPTVSYSSRHVRRASLQVAQPLSYSSVIPANNVRHIRGRNPNRPTRVLPPPFAAGNVHGTNSGARRGIEDRPEWNPSTANPWRHVDWRERLSKLDVDPIEEEAALAAQASFLARTRQNSERYIREANERSRSPLSARSPSNTSSLQGPAGSSGATTRLRLTDSSLNGKLTNTIYIDMKPSPKRAHSPSPSKEESASSAQDSSSVTEHFNRKPPAELDAVVAPQLVSWLSSLHLDSALTPLVEAIASIKYQMSPTAADLTSDAVAVVPVGLVDLLSLPSGLVDSLGLGEDSQRLITAIEAMQAHMGIVPSQFPWPLSPPSGSDSKNSETSSKVESETVVGRTTRSQSSGMDRSNSLGSTTSLNKYAAPMDEKDPAVQALKRANRALRDSPLRSTGSRLLPDPLESLARQSENSDLNSSVLEGVSVEEERKSVDSKVKEVEKDRSVDSSPTRQQLSALMASAGELPPELSALASRSAEELADAFTFDVPVKDIEEGENRLHDRTMTQSPEIRLSSATTDSPRLTSPATAVKSKESSASKGSFSQVKARTNSFHPDYYSADDVPRILARASAEKRKRKEASPSNAFLISTHNNNNVIVNVVKTPSAASKIPLPGSSRSAISERTMSETARSALPSSSTRREDMNTTYIPAIPVDLANHFNLASNPTLLSPLSMPQPPTFIHNTPLNHSNSPLNSHLPVSNQEEQARAAAALAARRQERLPEVQKQVGQRIRQRLQAPTHSSSISKSPSSNPYEIVSVTNVSGSSPSAVGAAADVLRRFPSLAAADFSPKAVIAAPSSRSEIERMPPHELAMSASFNAVTAQSVPEVVVAKEGRAPRTVPTSPAAGPRPDPPTPPSPGDGPSPPADEPDSLLLSLQSPSALSTGRSPETHSDELLRPVAVSPTVSPASRRTRVAPAVTPDVQQDLVRFLEENDLYHYAFTLSFFSVDTLAAAKLLDADKFKKMAIPSEDAERLANLLANL